MQTTILVRLRKEPRSIHESGTAEEPCDLLVPERNVAFAVVDDGTKFGVVVQVFHELVHA